MYKISRLVYVDDKQDRTQHRSFGTSLISKSQDEWLDPTSVAKYGLLGGNWEMTPKCDEFSTFALHFMSEFYTPKLWMDMYSDIYTDFN